MRYKCRTIIRACRGILCHCKNLESLELAAWEMAMRESRLAKIKARIDEHLRKHPEDALDEVEWRPRRQTQISRRRDRRARQKERIA